ncbi:hypothetical protein SOVF_020920, partial [Spinacia oleracea]
EGCLSKAYIPSIASKTQILAFLWFSAYGSAKVHIVYMGDRKHQELQQIHDSHHQILANLLGSKKAAEKSILYSYKHGFSGFAAMLTKSQAEVIADHPEVISVLPNRILHVQTTRSWDFLNVKPQLVNGILSKAHHGAGTIIGIIDSGIWPESKSFRDDGMKGVPSRWRGICQGGERFNHSHCNKKIIGARWYIKGYEAVIGDLDRTVLPEFLSPRDAIGHGTHTASTAAGAFVKNARFSTLEEGLARGGAPSAHLAVYKACWGAGICIPADVLAAFDDAISDGVDVLSVSLSFPPPLDNYMNDPIAVGSFHATAQGIAVVCSAGNVGPQPQTVVGVAPWMITVAASSTDKAFPSAITLGNNQTLWGQSLLTGKDLNMFYPLVFGGDIATSVGGLGAINCASGSLDTALAQGKVVLCYQSQTQSASDVATETVKEAKGAGLIFAQFPTKDVYLTSKFPTVLVDYTIGTSVLNYIRAASQPRVKLRLTKTIVGRQYSPEVASFSSRGPSSFSPQVLKPDIAAPGVNILAAWAPVSELEALSGRLPPQNFRIASGTSMSCPHVSGIVALLKAVHPTWSPAAIKSAIITTASTKDRYEQHIVAEGFPHKVADAFDYGGGHIEPNKAIDPGLIYDMKTSDYIPFLCLLGHTNSAIKSMTKTDIKCPNKNNSLVNLNLPSISIPELKNSLVVKRTVTNVGPALSVYKARIEAPGGVSVEVNPSVLAFNSTAKKLKFTVTFTSLLKVQGRYSFGYLYWEDGFYVVRIPLVVRIVIEDYYSYA